MPWTISTSLSNKSSTSIRFLLAAVFAITVALARWFSFSSGPSIIVVALYSIASALSSLSTFPRIVPLFRIPAEIVTVFINTVNYCLSGEFAGRLRS